MRVVWSARAVSDLQSISNYIEEATGLQSANRISRNVYKAAQSLKSLPGRGRLGRIPDTRELLVSNLPYRIIYRLFDERVLILNIVHAKQQWP
jgi:toxin ParE1/3/4